MPYKYISFNQCFAGLRFAPMFIWKHGGYYYKEAAKQSGLADNDIAICLMVESRGEYCDFDFFEPEDFISFEELLQIFALEGHGSYIAEAVKQEIETYLAYYKKNTFFVEQLKFFYEPNISNHILVMDDRVANNIVIFEGLFLG